MQPVQSFISGNGDNPRTLVVVFLRGGADGLNMVAPLGDDGYYKARPRIAIRKDVAFKLDGFFGLNPLLKELGTLYQEGALAVIHAAGSEDTTRSHFEAQDFMEHGGLVAGGWLGRFLRNRPKAVNGPLGAIAVGKAIPECLRGAPAATVMQSLDEFSLGAKSAGLMRELGKLYGLESDAMGKAGRDTLEALARIDTLRAAKYVPAHGAEYGRDEFAQGLRQIARLVKARVGLEAASIDLNGWDSHLTQGPIMDPLMGRLSKGLAAFHRDLGTGMEHVTVVVMTEFGRRLAENSAFGTDHGRGGVMFALGGGVKGGRVLGQWPGLKDEVLEGPGDLPVMNNYRNVLAPILERHGAKGNLAAIFPGFELEPLAVYG
jgi:uncharacterized protein (DUF1501 family)